MCMHLSALIACKWLHVHGIWITAILQSAADCTVLMHAAYIVTTTIHVTILQCMQLVLRKPPIPALYSGINDHAGMVEWIGACMSLKSGFCAKG